jgi:hypothetical protein
MDVYVGKYMQIRQTVHVGRYIQTRQTVDTYRYMIRLGTKGRYIQINVTVCIYLHTMYRYLSVSTYIRCIRMYLPFVYVWERQKVLQNRIVNQIMFS